MSNFASLKKSSADISRLSKEIEKLNSPYTTEREEDERFWKPTLDKAGNGYAVIRFLPGPAVDGDDALPWVRIFSHFFKGPSGKWYVENSLTTLGKKDPVSDFNSKLYNSTEDKDSPERKQATAQKRRLTYISNIYVVADPKNPENEGKVFLYKYGSKIFDKLNEAMNPPFDEMGRGPDDPNYNPTNRFSPFDLWKGANFKLTVKSIKQPDNRSFPNYDSSTWATPAPLLDDDNKLEAIWKSEYSLKEFHDPKHFKSYEELKAKLDEVLAEDKTLAPASHVPASAKPSFDGPKAHKSVEETAPWNEAEEDDDMAIFKRMAEE